MMLPAILSVSVSRDTVVSQLCAVIVPPILLVVIMSQFWGKPIAFKLLKLDSLSEGLIKPRAYGIIRYCIICLFCICLIIYFSLNSVWDMVVCVVLFLAGYSWITYSNFNLRLEYTEDHLIYCTGKTSQVIHFSDIASMNWEGCRGSIVYYLVIHLGTGRSIELSSGNFVGLNELLKKYTSWKDAHLADYQ